MSADGAPILVVGGSSRIATALVPLLDDAAYVVRRPAGRPREIVVEDYGRIPDGVWAGVHTVINCVGVSTGGRDQLQQVNVTCPTRLAVAAKAGGAGHLIHVSSFSVYGGAHAIGRDTPTRPSGDYGRSKLAADTALQALADDRFAVTILRLPLIYGEAGEGKLGQLLRWWARLRWLPVPAGDVRRAMIGVPLAAEVIARLAAGPERGVVFAADPHPFAYTEAARARPEALGRLPVPRSLARLAERAMPALGSRLFADSRLADDDNLAIRYGLSSRLYHDIAAIRLH